MLDGQWRTLAGIQEIVGGTESSISARLRDLRKQKFGGYQVDRERVHGGLYQYRVTEKETEGFQKELFDV